MKPFNIYCPTCDQQVLIKPPIGPLTRRPRWSANCEHVKDIYIQQLHDYIKQVEAAEWDMWLTHE